MQGDRRGIARHSGAAWPPLHDNGDALAFVVARGPPAICRRGLPRGRRQAGERWRGGDL